MRIYDYTDCNLCARRCSVNRAEGALGYCGASSIPVIARADLHFWEEPVISGINGSGTIFFSGCSLRCVYCQNKKISRSLCGREASADEIADIMINLEKRGAHNINFVTPTHFVPSVIESVDIARNRGLSVPIVYNTASYDTKETVGALKNTVDIYLPDFKYIRSETALELSHAKDYPQIAFESISEMISQQPRPIIENGIMKKGVIVRILLLPGHIAQAKLILKKVYSTFGDSIYISLMSQYTPSIELNPPLNRRVTKAEYRELVEYADKIGVKNGFIQQLSSSSEMFIPDFNISSNI